LLIFSFLEIYFIYFFIILFIKISKKMKYQVKKGFSAKKIFSILHASSSFSPLPDCSE